MKKLFSNHKRLFTDILVLIGVFVFVFISYFVFKPLYFASDSGYGPFDGLIPRIYITILLLAIVTTGIILGFYKKLNIEILLFLIFLFGVVMQLNYMLITPYNYRQHDVLSDVGHQGYATILYQTGKLPTKVDETGHLAYQFYHPPLNALMQAFFMRVCQPFMHLYNALSGKAYYDVTNVNHLYQTSEILATFYTNISLYFGIKIAYRLQISNRLKAAGAAFLALFPAMFILAGQENNDPLCIMNCFIVIYFTCKWWNEKTYFSAVMIGLFTGLAMMAKLSGALAILPALVAFIYSIINAIVKKETSKHYFIQGGIITVLAAPIGLWFQIYAKARFDQPFGFVFSNLNPALYVGDHNFFERFVNIFDFTDLTKQLWGVTGSYTNSAGELITANYNLPNFLIKSAIFGEYSFLCATHFGILTLAFNYLFVYTSLVLIIIYFIKSKDENLKIKIIAGSLLLTQLIAQLYFNIKMPYGCTMDFRYIVPIILSFMILDCLAFDKFLKEKSYRKVLSIIVLTVGGLFLVSSTLFYLNAI